MGLNVPGGLREQHQKERKIESERERERERHRDSERERERVSLFLQVLAAAKSLQAPQSSTKGSKLSEL